MSIFSLFIKVRKIDVRIKKCFLNTFILQDLILTFPNKINISCLGPKIAKLKSITL